ncbi:MAG: hypothetical protein LC776_15820, partial [Acidobacteria bacterium]|nr:hypothetical protein [Acidobacteriota bacterium]
YAPRSDAERLDLFCTRAERAFTRRAVTAGTIRSEFHVRLLEGDEMAVTTDSGDEEDVRSLLLEVRKFLSNDDTSFGRVANILERLLTDEGLKQANRRNRVAWKNALDNGLGYVDGGTHYTPKRLFRCSRKWRRVS